MNQTVLAVDKILTSGATERNPYAEGISLIEELRKSSSDAKNEEMANLCWQYRSALEVFDTYINVFEKIKLDDHINAWVDLERCEIKLKFLLNNASSKFIKKHKLDFIKRQVGLLQSLFPYKWFFSPGFIVGYYTCSICGHKIRPRSRCTHVKGKVYNGELCCHIVHEAEMLEVSLVTNPVQKYSVLQKEYDYTGVNYVVRRLSSPFDPWMVNKTTKAYPREMFASVEGEDQCPCVSGKKFIDCCFEKEMISIPHLQILFDKPFPPELQTEIFPYT